MHKLDKGSLFEGKILVALLNNGYKVSIPWSQNSRYDLIADRDGQLFRVQCKTAWLSKDGTYLQFNTCSCNATIEPRDYRGRADFFAIYSSDTGKVYLLPVYATPLTSCKLRLMPTKNKQKVKIRYAAQYELC